MKYCTQCGSEYRDTVTVCADDGNTELVPLEEMHRRGIPTVEERDTRKFVPAGTAEDPLSTERLTRMLEEASIPVFARPRRAGSVDALTGATITPWWEILVPEEQADRAAQLITEAKRQFEAEAEELARAAEEEALATAGARTGEPG